MRKFTEFLNEGVENLQEANHREFAEHGLMHPDMAKHMKVGSHMDYYERGTGDKVHGKVLHNDGKEVHVKQTQDSYDPKKKGTVHKFKVTSKLPEQQNEEVNITEETRHKVSVTISDPNHTMASKRKETYQKLTTVIAKSRETAVDAAVRHYKKQGYKVHDHAYVGLKEQLDLEESVADSWKKVQSMDKGSVTGDKEQVRKRLAYLNAVHAHHKKFGNDTKKVKDEIEKINRSHIAEESDIELDEAVESGNKGYGYHGQHESDVADKKYSAMHAKVKKIAGEAGHLKDAKKPNVMVKHYLDSRHGRHLAGNEGDHEYIKKDFGRFKKTYKPDLHEESQLEEGTMSDAQMKKREEIVKGMKKSFKDFVAKYGSEEKAKSVMYATATKLAMKEDVDAEAVQLEEAAADMYRWSDVNRALMAIGMPPSQIVKVLINLRGKAVAPQQNEETEQDGDVVEEGWEDMLKASKERHMRVGDSYKTSQGTATRTATGVRHERRYHDDDDNDDDEKKPASTEKRGRGRPKGSTSGARQQGSGGGKDYRGIATHSLNLPNTRK